MYLLTSDSIFKSVGCVFIFLSDIRFNILVSVKADVSR